MKMYRGFEITLDDTVKRSIHVYVVKQFDEQVFPVKFNTESKAMAAIDLWLNVGKNTNDFLMTINHPKKLNHNNKTTILQKLLGLFKSKK